MSLFGALLGDFDDDNFIGNPMNSMNMQMRSMNRLMNSMMMPDPFNMLTPFDNRFNGGNSLMDRSSMLGGGGLFGFPNIPNMNRLLSADIGGNGASFCSSSVISMSSGPDGRPQIYQATSSTKTGPGGIRETRKTVQDSSSGVKKMAIGHHIGERAHIIEKEQNMHSGQHEERQEFINLDEDEAESFDREFTSKARMHTPAVEITGSAHHSPHHRQYQRALPALPAPPSANTSSASSSSSLSSSSSPVTAKSTATASAKKTSTAAPATTALPSSPSSSSPSLLSAATRRALRNASMATPRRPLRTPTSSPLAMTTSGHNSTSTTTSVHPHPYNNAAARRNFRAKHSKHQQHHTTPQHQQHQQQQQHQEEQQQHQEQQQPPQQATTESQQQQESNNSDSN